MEKTYDYDAVEYIAKQAQGGMRDAITTLDKCLAYNNNLTLANVIKVLSGGVTPYELSIFTKSLMSRDVNKSLNCLDEFYMSGIDMNLLLNMYFEFLLNLQKYLVLNSKDVSNLPADILDQYTSNDSQLVREYIQKLFGLINAPKMDIKSLMEAWVIERCI